MSVTMWTQGLLAAATNFTSLKTGVLIIVGGDDSPSPRTPPMIMIWVVVALS